MNVSEPSVNSTAEDLSDRSNSSNSDVHLHAFQEYGKIKELNLSINKGKDTATIQTKDFGFASQEANRQQGFSFGGLQVDEPCTKELPVALDKPKEFADFQSEKVKDVSSYSMDRSEDTDVSLDATKEYSANLMRPKDKEVIFNFDGIRDVHSPREARDSRTKNIHFPVDRNKDINFQKTYNHPLERIKDFNFALDRRRDNPHVGGLALERLRGGSFMDPASDYRNPQMQPRDEIEAITIETMRRSHIFTSEIASRNLPAHFSHPHSITEMNHSQQQQQQQGKSFTIDSILGLRNNQRDKQQRSRQHPYRKHQGHQEGLAKNGSSGSNSGGGGKLKRVRTIFTAEQLERLEAEFARQQYMVGPERQYLAHALGLTEAQVKVWFQNRRIKWRKLHHEQQSQRLHELHSLSSLEQDVDDSNDNADCREAIKIAGHRTSDATVFKPYKILDTISEHTEPSPVPSTTMEQTEHDLKSQARRLPRGRHGSSYPWPMSSWTPRLSADGTSASDPYCRKASPRLSHSVPHSHEQRRLDYGMAAEPVTSCYSSLNTHRQKNRTLTSVAPKFSSYVPISDQTHRSSRHTERMTRNKLLTTNNVAVVRKPCYKDEPEEYEEDDVNYPDENADEEPPGEADEDQDEAYEFNDKGYEEQEADDEIDDESDAFQAQLQRLQNKTQLKPTSHRSQDLRHAENCTSTDLRKLRHQQQIHKMFQDQKIPRHYPQPLETQQTIAHDVSYGDAADVLSDEERVPHSRRSSRGMSDTNQAMNSWFPPRKSLERNRERLVSPPVTAQHEQRQHVHPQQHLQHEHRQQQRLAQQSRKYRSTKPELESLMMPATARSNPPSKKCCICEGSTEPVMMKIGTPGKGNCRLQECRGFTVKGPTGEDGEAEEQVVCARCARRHNMEDFQSGCEAPMPEGVANSYGSKSHRSRQHHRSPTYECNAEDNNQTLDDVYSSRQLQPTDTIDYRTLVPRERTRHSVQSARSPFRGTRYG